MALQIGIVLGEHLAYAFDWSDVPVLFLARNDGDEARAGVEKFLLLTPGH